MQPKAFWEWQRVTPRPPPSKQTSKAGEAISDNYELRTRLEADRATYRWDSLLGLERYDTPDRQMWAGDGR